MGAGGLNHVHHGHARVGNHINHNLWAYDGNTRRSKIMSGGQHKFVHLVTRTTHHHAGLVA